MLTMKDVALLLEARRTVVQIVKSFNITRKVYRKNPKNLDTRKHCCSYPKIVTVTIE